VPGLLGLLVLLVVLVYLVRVSSPAPRSGAITPLDRPLGITRSAPRSIVAAPVDAPTAPPLTPARWWLSES
jgi:hypothetical protein